MTATITTRVEEKVLEEIDQLSKEKQMDRASLLRNLIVEGLEIEKEKKVLGMYKDRKISLAKAAEMLGLDLWQMIDLIREENIYLDYSEEELKEDLKGLEYMKLISNASPLIFLAKVDKLELLRDY